MVAPTGYIQIPNDVQCRCLQQWQERDGSYWCCGNSKTMAEIERLRAALEPFAGVARWAERNGHDLTKGWDMLLRQPDGGFAGHLQVQSPDFIAALTALNQQEGKSE